jgi:hypothetical protein
MHVLLFIIASHCCSTPHRSIHREVGLSNTASVRCLAKRFTHPRRAPAHHPLARTFCAVLERKRGTVFGFRQEFTLEGGIEFLAFVPLEALPCVWSTGMPLGCSLFYRLIL